MGKGVRVGGAYGERGKGWRRLWVMGGKGWRRLWVKGVRVGGGYG